MIIIYDCELTEPPSSVYCFRDATLYSEIFLKNDNLIKCPKGTKSLYWKWIRKHGAHDFIKEIISNEEHQEGATIGRNCLVNFKLLNESNLQDLISIIKRLS